MTGSETTTTIAGIDVSRETLDALRIFQNLVEKWNPAINLISKADVSDLWDRHIVDSAQVFAQLPPMARRWCDLGSGGGFPALVVAIISKEKAPDLEVVLIEADKRKSVFLREVVRVLGLRARVEAHRIDEVEPQLADVVSARALASVSVLCQFAESHLKQNGIAVFLKGVTASAEIDEARRSWNFDLATVPSVTDSGASILILKEIRHV